jgi:methylmalonyl-CoA mutase, N-terminal domain
MQREIQNAAFVYQREIETKQRIIVGVNEFISSDDAPGDILKVNPAIEEKQQARVARVRAERDQAAAAKALAQVEACARGEGNLMPPIIDAVRCWATLGEIADAMRRVFGEYQPANEV